MHCLIYPSGFGLRINNYPQTVNIAVKKQAFVNDVSLLFTLFHFDNIQIFPK